MKKISMIVAAMALVLGLSQCKKDQGPKVIEEPVEITLDVSANSGAKIDVNTESGAVSFEQDDQVLVASGGKYVGTLSCRGDKFKGQITGATTGQPLYFYFLANRVNTGAMTPGTTTSCTVDISDQTSGKLPVISSAASDQNFTGEGNYTAYFLNRAALVKFNVTTADETQVTVIRGMNNKVTVSFANVDEFAYSMLGKGEIKLPAGNGERWAILLPQPAKNGTTALTNNRFYGGGTTAVPQIKANGYLFDGINVDVTTPRLVDLGLSKKWAGWNVGAETPADYGNYYAWGETAPKDPTQYIDSTYHYYYPYDPYDPTTLPPYGFTLPADHDAATANWGEDWRMPTKAEFEELFTNTTRTYTTLYGHNGWLFTSKVEGNNNSIFFPAAGGYLAMANGTSSWSSGGSICYYWTNSFNFNATSYWFRGDQSTVQVTNYLRYDGASVRPVYIGAF